tara:strand:+ start:1594 stop:3330 length:1737 start_codon:yes stop_codon:yes gene_type:complete
MTKSFFVFGMCVLLGLSVSVSVFASEEKVILGKVLKLYQSISETDGSKSKLKKMEKIVDHIDTIKNEYAHTDLGIRIITEGSLGKIDLIDINDQYISALLEYFETVCEATPSLDCIASTALKIGIEGCEDPKTIFEARAATKNIRSSIGVFETRKSKHAKFAVSQYFECVQSLDLQFDTFTSDRAKYQLMKYYLNKRDDEDKAKAIIEQIELPIFKIYSIVDLKEKEGKTVKRKYINRLQEYYQEKTTEDNKSDVNDYLLMLKLRKFQLKDVYKRTTPKGDFYSRRIRLKRTQINFNEHFGGTCNDVEFRARYYNLAYHIYGELKEFMLLSRRSKKRGLLDQTEIVQDVSRDMSSLFEGCETARTFDLMLLLIDILIQRKSKENLVELEKFLGNVLRDPHSLLEKFVELEIKSKEDVYIRDIGALEEQLIEIEEKLEEKNAECEEFTGGDMDKNAEGKMKITCLNEASDIYVKLTGIESAIASAKQSTRDTGRYVKGGKVDLDALISKVNTPESTYLGFKKTIEFGRICDGIARLYTHPYLKDSDYFNRGVDWLLTSGYLDQDKDYQCGDAELSVLLK